MLNKTLEQTAIGNGIFKQSGRDLIDNSVNITVIPSFDDFFIYEDDIKEIISEKYLIFLKIQEILSMLTFIIA